MNKELENKNQIENLHKKINTFKDRLVDLINDCKSIFNYTFRSRL